MGRAFGHKKGTTTASSSAAGATGASCSPSEARRAQAQPCSHLARKQPRPSTVRQGPARPPMTPCGPSPAPPVPDTSHLPRGLPGCLPEWNRPGKTAHGLRICPKEIQSPQKDLLNQKRPKYHQFASLGFSTLPSPSTPSSVK
uniref:Uncharacterized protein n=1 Tax=Rousettus aegyptiacus TaxID=9407 RepID=A0A7J8IP37_ROUAE|nr:hypothetical protein HJG63_010783 [Rousettus aegyptiacus]